MNAFKTVTGAVSWLGFWVLVLVLYATNVLPLWDPSRTNSTSFKHGLNVGECIAFTVVAAANVVYQLAERRKRNHAS